MASRWQPDTLCPTFPPPPPPPLSLSLCQADELASVSQDKLSDGASVDKLSDDVANVNVNEK